jgi:hypothetical protein
MYINQQEVIKKAMATAPTNALRRALQNGHHSDIKDIVGGIGYMDVALPLSGSIWRIVIVLRNDRALGEYDLAWSNSL